MPGTYPCAFQPPAPSQTSFHFHKLPMVRYLVRATGSSFYDFNGNILVSKFHFNSE